jgi:hypothetical protein
MNYKSEVLKCNVDDHSCTVCNFLNGKEDKETLLYVIKILDSHLFNSELIIRSYTNDIVKNKTG